VYGAAEAKFCAGHISNIDMFTTILKYKSDQINKTSRSKRENKMESKFNLEPQIFLAYATSKASKIQRNIYKTFKKLASMLR